MDTELHTEILGDVGAVVGLVELLKRDQAAVRARAVAQLDAVRQDQHAACANFGAPSYVSEYATCRGYCDPIIRH